MPEELKLTSSLTDIIAALQQKFDAQPFGFSAEVTEFRGEVSLLIAPEKVQSVMQSLRDDFGFDYLASLTASDYWPQLEPRFHVVYQVYSFSRNMRLCLRVPVNDSTPTVPTVENLYPVANWHEREVWDMFGIRFEGHPDLRRILMPGDWEGHPLRKDYPLGYEEPQFTFNFDTIQVRKHRAGYEEA